MNVTRRSWKIANLVLLTISGIALAATLGGCDEKEPGKSGGSPATPPNAVSKTGNKFDSTSGALTTGTGPIDIQAKYQGTDIPANLCWASLIRQGAQSDACLKDLASSAGSSSKESAGSAKKSDGDQRELSIPLPPSWEYLRGRWHSRRGRNTTTAPQGNAFVKEITLITMALDSGSDKFDWVVLCPDGLRDAVGFRDATVVVRDSPGSVQSLKVTWDQRIGDWPVLQLKNGTFDPNAAKKLSEIANAVDAVQCIVDEARSRNFDAAFNKTAGPGTTPCDCGGTADPDSFKSSAKPPGK